MGNVDVTFLISTKFCIIINRCHNMFRAHMNDPNTDADSDHGTLASEASKPRFYAGHQWVFSWGCVAVMKNFASLNNMQHFLQGQKIPVLRKCFGLITEHNAFDVCYEGNFQILFVKSFLHLCFV